MIPFKVIKEQLVYVVLDHYKTIEGTEEYLIAQTKKGEIFTVGKGWLMTATYAGIKALPINNLENLQTIERR